jgi:hypothetical protein
MTIKALEKAKEKADALWGEAEEKIESIEIEVELAELGVEESELALKQVKFDLSMARVRYGNLGREYTAADNAWNDACNEQEEAKDGEA